ncbi:hypothetical protein [Luteimonas cucumeris]|uniref:hypothetical protein n=1 Tax=Luteimonas cucumeris TaxID=985012 RepID=UPI0018F6A070|nr:hypothetical protein [Luteimonas cucumeris]
MIGTIATPPSCTCSLLAAERMFICWPAHPLMMITMATAQIRINVFNVAVLMLADRIRCFGVDSRTSLR